MSVQVSAETVETSEKVCSQFCPCGAHVALVTTATENVWMAVEYASDGYTATDRRHVCPPLERRPVWMPIDGSDW